MGRTPVHTADTLLDAAVELFAGGGAQAVTMTAVARSADAPSGSVYHRFPDRPSLLAAMWLRTTRGFADGYRGALADQPTPASAIAAAVWCVDWCRAHPGQAAVLHAGRQTLRPEAWPAELEAEHADQVAVRDRYLAEAIRAIAAQADRPRDEVAFAMLDLPLGVVRRHLNAGEAVPESASDRVRRIATRIVLG